MISDIQIYFSNIPYRPGTGFPSLGNRSPNRLGTAFPTGREKLQNRQNKEKGDGLRAGEQPPSAMPLQQRRGEGKAFHGHGGGSCSATAAPPQSAYPAGPASCRSVQG